MSDTLPTIDRICLAAAEHFSVTGYDASSLAEIAAAVGIRKASLYAHFANKDALFLRVLSEAIAAERLYLAHSFGRGATSEPAGEAYLQQIGDRYDASVHLRFMLKAVFHHPVALKQDIGAAYEGFLTTMRGHFRAALEIQEERINLAAGEVALYVEAYCGIVESLFVDLNYAERGAMELRRDAMWRVFGDALKMRKSCA